MSRGPWSSQLIISNLNNAGVIGGNHVCKNDDQNDKNKQNQTDHCALILFQPADNLFGLTGTLKIDVTALKRIGAGARINLSHQDYLLLLYLARIRGSMKA